MSARDPQPALREGDGPEVLSLRRVRLRKRPWRRALNRRLSQLAQQRWGWSALALLVALPLALPGQPLQGTSLGEALGMTLPDLRRGGYGPEVLAQMQAALHVASQAASQPAGPGGVSLQALGAYRALSLVWPVLYAVAALAWLARGVGRRRVPLVLLALPLLTLVAALGENLGLAWQLWFAPLAPPMAEAVGWASRAKWWLILLLWLALSTLPAWPRHGRRRLDQLLR